MRYKQTFRVLDNPAHFDEHLGALHIRRECSRCGGFLECFVKPTDDLTRYVTPMDKMMDEHWEEKHKSA